MPAPRYVLFDAVGTLIEPRPAVAETYADYGARFGSQLSVETIRTRFAALFAQRDTNTVTSEEAEHQRWRSLVLSVFDDVGSRGEELFEALWQHFAEPTHWRLYDDVAPAWELLTDAGATIGIASNFDGRLRGICRELPPLDECQYLFISSEVGFAKPDPRFFAALAAQLGATPCDLWLVGDDPERDVAAARRAGWQATLIDRGGNKNGLDVVGDLRELVQ